MGLMDKVKAQTEQAMAKAQQGLAQGQSKLDAMQAKRAADGLLRELGAAVYAHRRNAGPAEAVEAALTALDAHVAEHGPLGGPADAPAGGSTQTTGGADPTGGPGATA
jgi:hypothetical protein